MQITITGIDELQKKLNASAKSIAYGVSKGINDTLYGLHKELGKEIKDSFDRPTPYIQKGVRYTKATKENLSGGIAISEESPRAKALSPAEVLRPHIRGGDRATKASERLLRRIGVMAQGQYIVPGKHAPIDQYGNIPGPQMVKILSAAGLMEHFSGRNMNQTARSKKKKGFAGKAYCVPFVGVFWRVTEKTSYPILHFTYDAPTYEAGRFDFYYIADTYIEKHLRKNLESAIAYALRTAR